MTDGANQLRNLLELAKEPSAEHRRELLSEITDLFMDHKDDLNVAEMGHCDSIMGRLAYTMEVQVRAKLAEQLSQSDVAPRNLILKLANDEIEVAHPILIQSRNLTDEDLVDIIYNQGPEHRLSITQRAKISEQVTDVLVDVGEDEIAGSLIKNEGARFSRNSFEKIVAKSKNVATLQAPLVNRRDVPPDLMHKMFWWVSKQLRQKIIETTADIDQKTLDDAIHVAEQEVLKKPNRRLKMTIEEIEVQKLHRKGELKDVTVLSYARNRQFGYLTASIALLAKIDSETAKNIFFNSNLEGLAIVCRSLGFDSQGFGVLSNINMVGGDRSSRELAEMSEYYEKIDVSTAQRVMRFWRIRKSGMDNTQSKSP